MYRFALVGTVRPARNTREPNVPLMVNRACPYDYDAGPYMELLYVIR